MQTKPNDHEKIYRNTACLCARPLLTQRPEERGANLYRCIACGGWRRIPPAQEDAEPETDGDHLWYEVAILVLIIIALAAVLIADATLRQNMQLLQEVIRR